MLTVDAEAILAFRLRAGHLDARLGAGAASVRDAVHAGAQDSMPRAAVLSLHARVEDVTTRVLDDPVLTQVWGPGFSAYVVAAADVATFTLGRYPDRGRRRTTADRLSARLADVLDAQPREYRDVGTELGVDPNQLRYAALTGTIRLHWAGAGKPKISRLPAPDIDPLDARCELARRFLHVYGPATVEDFATWAGVTLDHGRTAFDGIESETIAVTIPIGEARLLAVDEERLCASAKPVVSTRLLPSGDAFTLWTGEQRRLLVDDAERRSQLWTPRVWPGAVLIDGRIGGTWRRAANRLTIDLWEPSADDVMERLEAEAASLPLVEQPLVVSFSSME